MSYQDSMRLLALGSRPDFQGLAVEQGEAQLGGIGRPTQPESPSRQDGELASFGSVFASNIKSLSGGIKNALAIRHPGRVVG